MMAQPCIKIVALKIKLFLKFCEMGCLVLSGLVHVVHPISML